MLKRPDTHSSLPEKKIEEKEKETETIFPPIFPIFEKPAIGYHEDKDHEDHSLDSLSYLPAKKHHIYYRHHTLEKYLNSVSSDHMIVVGDDEDTDQQAPSFRALNFNLMHSSGNGWNGIFSYFSDNYSTEPDFPPYIKKPQRPTNWLKEQLSRIEIILQKENSIGVITLQEFDRMIGSINLPWKIGSYWEEISSDSHNEPSSLELSYVKQKPEKKDITNKMIYVYPLPLPPQGYWSRFKNLIGLQPQQAVQYGFAYRFENTIITGQYNNEHTEMINSLEENTLSYFNNKKLVQPALDKAPRKNFNSRPILYNTGLYKKAVPCRITHSISIHLPQNDLTDGFNIVLLKPKKSKLPSDDLSDAIAVVNVHFPHNENPIVHENMVKSITETIGKVYPTIKRIEFSGDFNVRRANVKPGAQPNVTNVTFDRLGSQAQQEDRTDIMLSAVKNEHGQWSINHRATTTYSPTTGKPLTKDSIISPDLTPDQPHYFQPAFLSENLPVYGLLPKKLEETAKQYGININIRRSESQHVDTEFRLVFFGLSDQMNNFFQGPSSLVPETNNRGRPINPGDPHGGGYFHLDPVDPLQRAQLLKLFFKVIGKNIHPYQRGRELYQALWPLVILECIPKEQVKKDTNLSEVLREFDAKPLEFINNMLKNKYDDESLAYYVELVLIHLEEKAKKTNKNVFNLLGEIVKDCKPSVIETIRKAAYVRYPQAAEKNAINEALKDKAPTESKTDKKIDLAPLLRKALHASYYIYQESHKISQIKDENKRNDETIRNNNELKYQQNEWLKLLNALFEFKTSSVPLSEIDQFVNKELEERMKELNQINATIIAQFERALLYFDEKQKSVQRVLLLFDEIKSAKCDSIQEVKEQAVRLVSLISYLEQDK